jgi:hypothetical protein
MALGGIAVSGGATGHATIISCNLLYSPLMLDAYGNQAARPAYTLGGTAGATGFGVAFSNDRDQRTLFKTAAAGTDLTLTMIHGASPPTVYGVVLLGHNLTETNIDDAADSFAGAWFEGGNDTDYDTISAALTLNADALTPAYHLLASPQAYDHWRVRVNFNSSLALQIGEVFLIGAAPLALTKNYNWGFVDERELGMIKNDGTWGVPRIYSRWERRRLEIAFTHISSAQVLSLQEAARNGHVIFSPSGASGYAYFGVLELEPPKMIHTDMWDVVAHFTESAR